MADTDSLERIRKALEEIDALPVEKFPSFKAERARQNLESACNPVAIRSLLAREAALREALEMIAWSNDSKWQADCARAALASTEPTKEAP